MNNNELDNLVESFLSPKQQSKAMDLKELFALFESMEKSKEILQEQSSGERPMPITQRELSSATDLPIEYFVKKLARQSPQQLDTPQAQQIFYSTLQQTISTIKKYTDRKIVVRHRPASREIRVTTDTFIEALQKDISAVVVWASNCGVEAAQHGIPVVSLGPSACTQISGKIEQIDNLPTLDADLTETWLRWLSYNQFSLPETESGLAWRILQENYASNS
jgi:hypothetical protein